MSFPDEGWLERPWPRRSCATTRKPCCARNSSWPSHASALSGQPCENVTTGPSPQSFVVDFGAVLSDDRAHFAWVPFLGWKVSVVLGGKGSCSFRWRRLVCPVPR